MYTTIKKSKLVTRLSLEQDFSSKKKVQRYRNESSLDGRVVILCLSTFFFGYSLTYLPALANYLYAPSFG